MLRRTESGHGYQPAVFAKLRKLPKLLARQLLTSLSVAIFFLSASKSFAKPENITLVREPLSLLQLGRGFDPETGDVKDICVITNVQEGETAAANEGLPAAGLDSSTIESSIVEKKSDLLAKLTADGSIGFQAFSASASATASISMTEYDLNLLFSFRVEKGMRSLSKVSLPSAPSDDLLSLAKLDPQKFRRLCGTHFVVAEHTGGYLFALIKISTSNQEDYLKVKNKAEGLLQGIKLGGELGTELKRTLNEREVKIYIFQGGGTKSPGLMNTDLDGFIKGINESINDIINNPAPRIVTLWPYEKARDWPDVTLPVLAEAKLRLRQKMVEDFLRVDELYNKGSYILTHPDQFEDFDRVKLLAYIDVTAKEWTDIEKSLKKCADDIDNCAPVIVDDLSFDFPRRKQSTFSACEMREDPVCGGVVYKIAPNIACGETYFAREDKRCETASDRIGETIMKRQRAYPCEGEVFHRGACMVMSGLLGRDISTPCMPGTIEIQRRTSNEPFGRFLGKCKRYPSGLDETIRSDTEILAVECGHPAFGVAVYSECADPSFGFIFPVCRLPEFGVEGVKTCSHPSNGIESSNKCLVKVDDHGQVQRCVDPASQQMIPQ